MGVIRFLIHPSDELGAWPEAYRAYVSGFDGRVFPTRIEIDGSVMTCHRQCSDSGKLQVAWPVPGFGRPVIATASLCERDAPYLLAVELARGKIGQVRNEAASWQESGLLLSDEFQELSRRALAVFARAVSMQDQLAEASELAVEAVTLACEASEELMRSYVQQRLVARRQRSPRLPASIGCCLGNATPANEWTESFCAAFDAAVVPIEWKSIEPTEGEYNWEQNDAQVEWCRQNKLMMCGGPLLDLSTGGLPQWLWQWENDFLNLQSFVSDFIETAITRYLGKVRLWEVVARANTGGAMALSEEERLTLTARALDVARQVDEDAQLLVRIDQPWGEYQARGQHRLTPLQFVDALIRSGVGLSGVNLEISVGYRPCGTSSRDRLDFSRMIDQWSALLRVPLFVTLAFPSAESTDRFAGFDLEVEANGWKNPWSPQAQAEWIDLHLPLLLTKQSVVSVFWSHFTDAAPHCFPHAGLLDAQGTHKPALQRIIANGHASWQ